MPLVSMRVAVSLAVGLVCATAACAAGTGLTGDYFTTNNFTGTKTTRVDATVNFDWGAGAPGFGGLGTNNFSIRWSGQLEPRYDETYTFYVTADEGATLWVNDRLLVSRWFAATPAQLSGELALKAGQRVNLRLEYLEKTGSASVRLEWASTSQAREVIPQAQLYPALMAGERGTVLREHWGSLPGTSISALTNAANYPNRPDGRELLLSFECLQPNWTTNLGTRVTGYLMPQTNGVHTFAVAASDTAELWLSTDTNPANKQRIASVGGATAFRDWTQQPSQISTGRTLVAWQKYYVELLHKAGTNDTHYSVAWQPPGAAQLSVIGADNLVPAGLTRALPAQANICDTLAAAHPRLLATAERFAWLRQQIATNGAGQPAQWYASLLRSATNLFLAAPMTYVQDNRGTILDKSRTVKDRMYLLGLAWKMTGDTNFPERAWTELNAAGNFPDWHPPHFLDTAEMTHGFAIGYDWFYEYWTPARRTFILTNLTSKGLTAGLTDFTNNAWWAQSNGNNWNMVCNGGLTLGALAAGTDVETTAEQVLSKTIVSQAPVMQHWTADNGAWYEGPGYWDYASDYNFRMLAGLQSALGSGFGLDTTNGLNNAGLFALLLTSAKQRNFNFADSGGAGVSGGPQMLWWARRFNLPAYSRYERSNGVADVTSALLWDDRGGDPAGEGVGSDTLFLGATGTTPFKPQHVGVFRSSWGDTSETLLAFKGGEMGASHGDLDAGTFVLEALGNRWAWDLGSDDYALPGYFDSNPASATNRWDYYRMRAEGQNTLVINPGNGPDTALGPVAPVLLFQSKAGVRALSVVDLTPVVTNVTRLWRGFQLLGPQRKQALVQDEIAGATNANVWWFMHYQSSTTQAALSSDGTSVTLTQGNNRLWVKLLGSGTFQIMSARPLPASPDPGGQNLNSTFQKLALHLTGVSNTTFAVWFVPLAPGESPPLVAPTLTPLAQWQIPQDDPPLALDGYFAAAQNTPVDVDLTTLASDSATPAGNLLFACSSATNGEAALLADGHTVRFTPAVNYYGTGQFLYSVTDTAGNTADAGVVITILPSTWYWDTSTAAGLQPANGIWDGSSSNWASAAAGSGPLQTWPAPGNDTAFIGAGGAYSIAISGTQRVNQLTTTNGTWLFSGGALKHASGSMTITAAADTTFTMPLLADTALIKKGAANLTLGATNSYSGETLIEAGTLTLGINNALPNSTAVTIGSTNGTVGRLTLNGCDQTIASLNFKSLSTATDVVSIAAGHTLTISNAASGIAFGVGNYGSTIGALTATTRVSFVGGGAFAVNTPNGVCSIEPSGTNNAGTALAVLDLSGLSNFTAGVSSLSASFTGGKPNNVQGQFTLNLATNSFITATNILLGASSYGFGTVTINLGSRSLFQVDTMVLVGGRYSGAMNFLAGASSNLIMRGVSGGTSRANLYIGDQVGLAGFGYGGGSAVTTGTLNAGSATVDLCLNQLTLGIGASVASQNYGSGNGILIFGGNASTVDVNHVFLGYATSNSTVATNLNSPTFTGTLSMNGGRLLVNSNIFLGYSADNNIGNTQRVTGVFNFNGGTATVASNLFLGCATNTSGTVTGLLNLSNGTFSAGADLLSAGVTATGTINLAGATLDLHGNKIGSAAKPINFVAGSGTLQNLAELNGGGTLVKSTVGTLTLAGTNTYTGATTVSAGTLLLAGRLTGGGVTVASNATLAGTGQMGGPVTILGGGVFAPGPLAGTGSLTLGNALTLATNAVLRFALGASNDLAVVAGPLTLGGRLNLSNAGGFAAGTYTLFTYSGGLTYNGLSIGTVPDAGLAYRMDTNTVGLVKLTATFLDSVGDGITDRWRVQYFGGTGLTTNVLSCAASDFDGDGLSNLQEYLAGTNPTNGASRLALISIALRTNDVLITWIGGTNAWQSLDCCEDLAANRWSALFTNVPPTPVTNSLLHGGAGAASNIYYRIQAWP